MLNQGNNILETPRAKTSITPPPTFLRVHNGDVLGPIQNRNPCTRSSRHSPSALWRPSARRRAEYAMNGSRMLCR